MQTTEIKKRLTDGEYRDLLLDIYVDGDALIRQTKRYADAVNRFEELFGCADVSVFSAPGRCEVGGNHTDHQHGEILAASVNLDAIAVAERTDTGTVTVVSDGFDRIEIALDGLTLLEEEKETTTALIKGVLARAKKLGYRIGGFRCYVTSDVLIGAGLSSSAAFETVIGTIVSHFYNGGEADTVTVAMIGQYAENVYFGKPCGLMDQMACSVGNLVHVDFANPDSPVVEKINFDLHACGYRLCITDTKGSHADLTADYAAVPAEMKNVAAYFGKDVLLGISMEDILSDIDKLRLACGDRAILRAIHFLQENERVRAQVKALKENDIAGFLTLVETSGNSSYKYLQNVYSCQDTAHQNISLALAVSERFLKERGGVCRVHGGGFAGTVLAFVRDGDVAEYAKCMEKVFGDGACKVLQIRKYGGIKVL